MRWMSKHWHALGIENSFDGFAQRRPQHQYVARLASTQESFESLLLACNVTGTNHPSRKMRTSDLSTGRFFKRTGHRARHADPLQLLIDSLGTLPPRTVEPLQVRPKAGCFRIEAQTDDVDAHATPFTGKLHTTDDVDACWQVIANTLVARDRVVIGNRKALHSLSQGTINQRCGGQRTIRSGTMCVEVDQGYLYTATRMGWFATTMAGNGGDGVARLSTIATSIASLEAFYQARQ